ncbi:MAG: hypothetical protein UHN88_02190 [Eubacterium sp.]|nr:hypothetical protein [Eubacterium sp.]
MARTMNMEALDRKIEKAQHEVSVAKKRYDSATAELKNLLDKRDAIRSKELLKLVAESSMTYEEVIKLIRNADKKSCQDD